ncbi:caspase family protein [Bacillus halotolerans]|uniref:caspase family protein n=1 Tax=Bacillus halotolerans TaxID=260554 RepID=UPI001C0EC9F1|nr:caspase family protein [Bacillus halotolerans]MBU5245303.1 caspase family protein [Bacillus halotolerans]
MGQKKALIIGINYSGSTKPLKGCIKDADAYVNLLVKNFGFEISDIQILIEDTATRQNILDGLINLKDQLKQKDDVGLFVYSGHGTRTADLPPIEEEDGLDEAIVPWDGIDNPNNYIRDDEIRNILNQINKEVHFTTIFDSCHSDTADRDLNVVRSFTELTPGASEIKKIVEKINENKNTPAEHPLANNNTYLIAACKSTQKAKDGDDNGLFTRELIRFIKKGLTYEKVKNLVVPEVKRHSEDQQEPQFSGPDLNSFIFGIKPDPLR